MIPYRLSRAGMQPGYFFKAIQRGRIDQRQLAESAEIGTTLSRSDFLASLLYLAERLESALLNGQAIQVEGVGIFFVSLRGKASQHSAQARPKSEDLHISFKPDARLLKRLRRQARFERVEAANKMPTLALWRDVVSEQDMVYTPGGIGEIRGQRLSFYDLQSDPTEGVFFVGADGSETRVEVYAAATGRSLTFMIPADLAGPQKVELRRRVEGPEATLQTIAWRHELTPI